jgi:cytochrome c553
MADKHLERCAGLADKENVMRRSLGVLTVAVQLSVFAAAAAGSGPLDSDGAPKALVCSACHGFGGNSPGNTVPIIAGMSPGYFKKAINDYAAGKRPSAEMEPFSKYVLQAGIDEIAAYFAEQKRMPTRIKAEQKSVALGKRLAPQCTVCHNPQGEGDPEKGFAVLRGQPPGYLQAQLMILKEDKRKLDDPALDELKKKLLKRFSDAEIAGLAAYFSSLK